MVARVRFLTSLKLANTQALNQRQPVAKLPVKTARETTGTGDQTFIVNMSNATGHLTGLYRIFIS